MKVHIYSYQSGTGRAHFFDRLVSALKLLGVEVTRKLGECCDISLQAVFIERTKAKCHVLRLDGVHHNVDVDYKKINNSIMRKGVNLADAIVYQSRFSATMCSRYLEIGRKPTEIIGNGAVLIDNKYEQGSKSVFFTASRWRPHKRLADIIESFLLADIEDAVLYVAGDLSKSGLTREGMRKLGPTVKYFGVLNQHQLQEVLKKTTAFLHLCWFDSCPNAVVEAIAAGAPVITNNVGGTKEIVELSNGIVLPIDSEYDFQPCKLYSPPPIDRYLVAQAILRCNQNRPVVDKSCVDINKVAERYRRFFVSLLE
ncbi:MAG: glycosyltransferase family 4 protein [Candidatus Thorarchaeota archaeon]